MKRALAVLALVVAAPGCMLAQYRQQGIEYSLGRTAKARDGIVAAAEAGREVAEEFAAAAAQERAPDVARPMERLVVALSAAHQELEEAGKTLAVLQEDLGRPPAPAPASPDAAEAWRIQYRAASRLWKMAMSWARSSLPILGKLPGSPQGPAGGGWSPTEIAGLMTAITAALAGAAELARRNVKSARTAREEAEANAAAASEAMDALDEVKARSPKVVKEACAPDKRPALRAAFVARETNGGAPPA